MNSNLNHEFMSEIGESVIDFKELWLVVWRDRLIVLIIVVLSAISAITFSISLPNQYQSEAVLEPVNSSKSPLANLAGGLGGLASLAGLNLGATHGDNKAAKAMELLKSWDFIEGVIVKNKLEADVFAAIDWDRASNTVIYNKDIYDVNNNKWLRDPLATVNGKSEPSGWELFEAMVERISVSQDDSTGLVSLSVEHYSPYVAEQWVRILLKEVNSHFQKLDRDEARQRINYLQKKIEETELAIMRNVFFEIIQEQTQILMLAEIGDEYVLKTLSPAKVAEKKSRPSRAVIVVLVTFLGGAVGILLAFIRYLVGR